MGPKTVVVDRFDYSTSIVDSWKQQTLLNIVNLRRLLMVGDSYQFRNRPSSSRNRDQAGSSSSIR
jgi:hypothetical protein